MEVIKGLTLDLTRDQAKTLMFYVGKAIMELKKMLKSNAYLLMQFEISKAFIDSLLKQRTKEMLQKRFLIVTEVFN